MPETCWDGTFTCDDCPETPDNYPDWPMVTGTSGGLVTENYNQFENNGSITGTVLDSEGITHVDAGDLIAAFFGDEIRGVAPASELDPFFGDGYVFNLMIYSNESSGELLSFKYYDLSEDSVSDIETTIEFVSNLVAGSALSPFEFVLSSGVSEIIIPLGSGWNWISINVEAEDMNVNTVFSQFVENEWQCDYGGANTDCPFYIKSQSSFGIYYSGFGFYPEFNMDVQSMFKVQMNAESELHFEGSPAAPDTELPLGSGWNWIGYIPNIAMPANTALVNIIANNTPFYIKSQSEFGIFYEDFGFYPEPTMIQYGGYQLEMVEEDVLIYPASGLGLNNSFISNLDENIINVSKYEHNGSISAIVDIDNISIDPEDILFAYHEGEIRGKANANIFPLTGEYIFSLMVYGDGIENENLDFKFYDFQTNQTFDLNQLVFFEPDMIISDAINPYVFDSTNNSIVSEFKIISVYPNPFNPITNISYFINESANIEVSIFDLMGRKVKTLENSFKESGEYTVSWDATNQSSGIYYIQISNGEMVKTQKLTLIK